MTKGNNKENWVSLPEFGQREWNTWAIVIKSEFITDWQVKRCIVLKWNDKGRTGRRNKKKRFSCFQANISIFGGFAGWKKLIFAILTVLNMFNCWDRCIWIKPLNYFFFHGIHYETFYKPACRICSHFLSFIFTIFCLHYTTNLCLCFCRSVT